MDIGISEVSPDNRLLAWSADTSGAEIFRLRFTDLQAGRLLPDLIKRSYPGGAWASDCEHFFYLVPDELNRPHQVWRHRLGTRPTEDVVVYEETDQRYELTLRASRSSELIVITAACRDTSEVRIIPAARPLTAPVLVEPRRRGVEYRVDHAANPSGGAGDLLIVTDDGAAEFTLMRAPVSAPGRSNWAPVDCLAVGPAQADTRLLSCDAFADRLLLAVRRAGSPLLIITDNGGGSLREIGPALQAGSIAVMYAQDYHAASVIIAEESLIEPPRWSELDLSSGERKELKRAEVPGYDAGLYRTNRIHARAADGTEVPVTLAYRSSTPLDGTAACLLYGYGAYEACLDPEFDRSLPSVLDRGVVYAIAHVRGGGECGRDWWQQGRLRNKPRTFSDFVEVADWLAGSAGAPAMIDGSSIVSRGLSAGGLLQGAVYSRAPGRWRAVVAEVPFVDCVTTMLDPSIPLTINEWDEWGDPRDPADFACLRSYSPYDNPPPGARPDLLVTGAVHDPRVLVHEPPSGSPGCGRPTRTGAGSCSASSLAPARTPGPPAGSVTCATRPRCTHSCWTRWAWPTATEPAAIRQTVTWPAATRPAVTSPAVTWPAAIRPSPSGSRPSRPGLSGGAGHAGRSRGRPDSALRPAGGTVSGCRPGSRRPSRRT